MPVATLSIIKPSVLDQFPDLQSVPPHRHFAQHDMVDVLRKAVPFDFISIGGLDLDNYRLGEGLSVDTNFPPAFLETYYADGLHRIDPFVAAARNAVGVVVEAEVYAKHPPSQRLDYVMRTFGVYNRTLVPVRRNDVVYGAICVTRDVAFDTAETGFLAMIAESLHRSFTAPLMEKYGAAELRLSDGEIACLRQASTGQTSEKVAEAVGYQVDTVNSYIKSAIKKLGASNRVEAIAEAIRRRLIA
jgi:DNA-binding CsgD family transcriptional regulator